MYWNYSKCLKTWRSDEWIGASQIEQYKKD